jgi:hypothetical protein
MGRVEHVSNLYVTSLINKTISCQESQYQVSFRGKRIYKPIYFHDSKIKIADFREAFFT